MKTNIDPAPDLVEYRALIESLNPWQFTQMLLCVRIIRYRRWLLGVAVAICAGVLLILAAWPAIAGDGILLALTWSTILAGLSHPRLLGWIMRQMR